MDGEIGPDAMAGAVVVVHSHAVQDVLPYYTSEVLTYFNEQYFY